MQVPDAAPEPCAVCELVRAEIVWGIVNLIMPPISVIVPPNSSE
jgi:hypothetical protein